MMTPYLRTIWGVRVFRDIAGGQANPSRDRRDISNFHAGLTTPLVHCSLAACLFSFTIKLRKMPISRLPNSYCCLLNREGVND